MDDYERAEKYLHDFYDYAMKLSWRIYRSAILRALIPGAAFTPWLFLRFKLFFAVRSRLVAPSDSHYREEMAQLVNVADQAEKQSPFFNILTSVYPFHHLALAIKEQRQGVTLKSLSKIHDWRLKHLGRHQLNLKEVFGFLFGIAALLLSTVPKPVVVKFFAYDEYQEATFWLVLGVVAYSAVIFIPAWAKQRRAWQRTTFVGDVLSYGALLEPGSVNASDGDDERSPGEHAAIV